MSLEERVKHGAFLLIREVGSQGELGESMENYAPVVRTAAGNQVLAWYDLLSTAHFHAFWLKSIKEEGDATEVYTLNPAYRVLLLPLTPVAGSDEARLLAEFYRQPPETIEFIIEMVENAARSLAQAGRPREEQAALKHFRLLAEWTWMPDKDDYVLQAVWAASRDEIGLAIAPWAPGTLRSALQERLASIRAGDRLPDEALLYWAGRADGYTQRGWLEPVEAVSADEAATIALTRWSLREVP